MTDSEKMQYFKNYDYASLILQMEEEPDFPVAFPKDAYYGFYLLAKSVGRIIRVAVGTNVDDEMTQQRELIDVASFYIETGSDDAKKTFSHNKPLTVHLAEQLLAFLSDGSDSWEKEEALSFIEKMNDLVSTVEKYRSSKSTLRSLDIFLARQWCRLLRVFTFLRVPRILIPHEYLFERDLAVCEKRGISKEAIYIIGFRIRFYRYLDDKRPGKMILLAEEWEMYSQSTSTNLQPFEYEYQVLALLDSDAHYKIGLEWVTLLEHRHPENIGFQKWHIRFLRHSGDYKEALQIVEDLLIQEPDDHEIYYLASNLHFLRGDYLEAKHAGKEAVRLGADDPASHLALAYANLYFGNYEKCLVSFQNAIKLDNTSVDAYRGMAKAQVMLGFPFDSMKNLRKAVKLDSEDADLYHDLADVYFMCGYLDECRKSCQICLKLDPECAGAYVLLGMLEIRINHEGKAGKWLTRALEIEPTNPIALNELAYIHHLSGDDDQSLYLLEKALAIAPDFPDVLCSLGIVYYYKSEFEKAMDYLDRALSLDPFHTGALVGKGNLYLAQSEAEEALVWYDKSLMLEPDYEEAIQGKISAFRAMGLEQEAFEWMQKSSEYGLDSEED